MSDYERNERLGPERIKGERFMHAFRGVENLNQSYDKAYPSDPIAEQVESMQPTGPEESPDEAAALNDVIQAYEEAA